MKKPESQMTPSEKKMLRFAQAEWKNKARLSREFDNTVYPPKYLLWYFFGIGLAIGIILWSIR